MRKQLRLLGMIALSIGVGATAHGQSNSESSASGLALGFNNINWHLTIDDIKRYYPDAKPPTANSSVPSTNMDALSLERYAYGGCHFRVTFYFAQGKLATIDAVTDGRPAALPCSKKILDELNAQYGMPSTIQSARSVVQRSEWKSANTVVRYITMPAHLEVTLDDSSGPQMVIKDFMQ